MASWIVALFLVAQPAAAGPSRGELLEVIGALAASSPADRALGARRAGATGHPLFLDPLRAMLKAKEPEVRAAAAEALGQLGVPATTADLNLLLGALDAATKDPVDQVALAAVRASARYPFPSVRERLMALAQDLGAPPGVREAAQLGLASTAPEARARLEAWLEMSGKEAQSMSLRAPRIDRLRTSDPLLIAGHDLLDVAPGGRQRALELLVNLPEDPATSALLGFASRSEDPAVRRKTVVALHRHHSQAATKALLELAQDPEVSVRAPALTALENRDDPGILPLLVRRLALEPKPELRQSLKGKLRGQPLPALVRALGAPAERVDDRYVRDALELIGSSTSAGARLAAHWLAAVRDEDLARQLEARIAREDPELVAGLTREALFGVTPDGGPSSDPLGPVARAVRPRFLALIQGRPGPATVSLVIAALARGDADPAFAPLLKRAAEEDAVAASIVPLLASKREEVRSITVAATERARGPGTAAACAAILAAEPENDAAFNLLLAQADDQRRGPLIELLGEPKAKARAPLILTALATTQDARLAASALALSRENPGLLPETMRLLENQTATVAVPLLDEIVHHRGAPEGLRAQAVLRLGALADPSDAVARLRPVANDASVDVKIAARDTLHRIQPNLFPEWDPYGRYPLIAESAGFGAAMLLIASDIAEAKLSPAFTAGAGLVLGAATPFLLTRKEEVSLGDAAYFGTIAWWGTLGGWGLGGSAGVSDRGVRVATLLGEGLGLTLGAVTLASAEWGLRDAALANATAAEVAFTAASLASLSGSSTFLSAGGAKNVGFVAGSLAMVPLALLSRRLEVRDDLGLIFTLMAQGAWLGLLAPGVGGQASSSDRLLGAVAGQGLGYLSGLLLAQVSDVSGRSLLFSGVGSVIGGLAFGGLGLSLEQASPGARSALTGAGSAALALSLGLLGDHLRFDPNDAWIIGLSTAIGGVAGARLDVRIARDDFRSEPLAGNVLLGLGVGAAAGLGLSQLVDATDAELIRTSGGALLFGVAGGGLGGMIPGLSPEASSALVGGSALAGALLTAPLASRLDLSPAKVAYASVFGLSLGALLSPTPSYYNDGSVPGGQTAGALFLGASAGFSGGLLLSQALTLSSSEVLFTGGSAAAFAAMGAGLGLLVPGLNGRPTIALTQGLGVLGLGVATWAIAAQLGGSGGSGFDPSQVAPGLLFAAEAALIGGLIPLSWRDGAIPSSEVGGGMLLGASLGLTAGYLVSGASGGRSGDDLAEAGAWSVVGNSIGAGIGLLSDERRAGAIATQSLGALGLAAGLWLAPRTSYALTTIPTMAVDAALLSGLGAIAPFAFGATAQQGAGGALIGAGGGLLLGAIYGENVSTRSDLEVTAFTLATSAIGLGLSSLRDQDDRARAAWVSGLGLGGLALGLSLTPWTRYEAADVGFTSGLTLLGALHGALIPRALALGSEGRDAGAGAAIGAGSGLLLGLGLSQLTTLDPVDATTMVVMGEAMGAVGAGLAWSVPGSSDAERVAAYQLAAAGGYAIASWLAPRVSVTGADWGILTLTTGLGAWHGSFFPSILGNPEPTARGGGVLLGTSLGLLGGLALATVSDLGVEDQIEAFLYASAGNLVGGGLGLLVGRDDAGRAGALEIGGLAALGLGLGLAEHTTISDPDKSLIGLGVALGTWHGAWAGRMSAGESTQGERVGGGALLGAGLGFLGASALAMATEIEPRDQVELGLLWAYGSVLGGGIGLMSAGGSNAGLALLEGGGALALTAGLLSASATTFSEGDVALIGLAAAIGAWHGSTLPVLAGLAGPDLLERRLGGALLGAGAFSLAAHLATQWTEYTPGDVAAIGSFTVLGNAIGAGLGLMIPGSDSRTRLALADGIGLSLAAGMLVFAPTLHLKGEDLLSYGLFAAMGTSLGALAPTFWHGATLSNVPLDEVGGGVLLGGGLGIAGAALLTNTLTLSADQRFSIGLGAAMGGLTGAGLGMALSTDDRLAVGLFQGLMLTGSAVVGATAAPPDFSLKNMALGTTLIGYLTWHQLGVTLLASGTDRQALGATMATIGIGSLAGTYLVPRLKLRGDQTLMLLAGAVWGSWLGGWSGAIVKDGLSDVQGDKSTGLLLLSSVLGSDLGLAVTSAVVGGLLDVEPARFAIINLAGLGGMMIGMLSAGFAKAEPLKAGNVIGSLSGLALGAIVTSFFDFGDEPSPYERPEASDEVPAAYRAPPATALSVRQWFPTTQVEPGPNGEARYMFGVQGTWD